MTQRRTPIIVLVTLIIGLGAGFVLRPVMMPVDQTAAVAGARPAVQAQATPRGMQYFAAHLEEARQIVAGCRESTVRGDECANAEQAVTEAEGRDRFKKFMGN